MMNIVLKSLEENDEILENNNIFDSVTTKKIDNDDNGEDGIQLQI